jgi:hypothetical protein
MKIKVNNYYITRAGKIAQVVDQDGEFANYIFTVKSAEERYTTTREGYRYNKSEPDSSDLVKKLRFRAGESYYTNGNTSVTLSEKEDQCGRYVYEGSNGFSYTAEGKVYLAEDCIDDLIKPLKFKEQKKYLTRNGNIATVLSSNPCGGFYQYEIEIFNAPRFRSKFSIGANGRLYRDSTSDEDIVSKFKPVEGQLYVDNHEDVYRYENKIMTQLTGAERGSQYVLSDLNIVRIFDYVTLSLMRHYENEVGEQFQIVYMNGDLAIGLMKDGFTVVTFNSKGQGPRNLLKEVI